jgi:hypothetical protein
VSTNGAGRIPRRPSQHHVIAIAPSNGMDAERSARVPLSSPEAAQRGARAPGLIAALWPQHNWTCRRSRSLAATGAANHSRWLLRPQVSPRSTDRLARLSLLSEVSAIWPPHDGFRRMRWNNLCTSSCGSGTEVPCELTSSIVPARGALPPGRNSMSLLRQWH